MADRVITVPQATQIAQATKRQLTELNGRLDQYEDVFTGDVDESVKNWLNEHPEATTTVQDGSLTEAKFSNALKLKTANSYVTPEMFGAKGDGITDDTTAINTAVASGNLIICNGDYYITSPINVGTGKTVFINKITSSNDAININGYGTRVIANEINASETCIKIANRTSCEHCCFQIYKLTGKIGVSYEGESWAQYNVFHGGKFECSEHCIHIVHPSDSTGWFNENHFYDVKCGGSALYGVYIINESSNKGLLNGNKFLNSCFENNNNAVYLNNVSYTVFKNCRIQEVGSNKKVLVLEGNNEYVEFHTPDILSVRKIDISLNTGENNHIIAPVLFNDGSGMTYHAYVDKTVITYSLRKSRLLNVASDITLDINSTTFNELPIYDVFTFRDTTAKHTLILSPQYGVKGINMIKFTVVGSGVSYAIKDSQGHTVSEKNNATAGTYIAFSDGTGYWMGGRLSL